MIKSSKELLDTFLLDCENIFNLTPPEATRMIETFREEIAQEPNTKAGFYSDLDVEVEIKRLTDTLFTTRIISCNSIDSFHGITRVLEGYFTRCQLSKFSN